MDGWRKVIMAERPRCAKPCPSPTVVVVLPSPKGVGVTAETRMYLAAGRSAMRSMASSDTLAEPEP